MIVHDLGNELQFKNHFSTAINSCFISNWIQSVAKTNIYKYIELKTA